MTDSPFISATFDFRETLSLDSAEASEIVRSYHCMNLLSDIEDIFGELVNSLKDFEETVLLAALDYEYSALDRNILFTDDRIAKINSRFLGLVAATRTYQDKVAQKIRHLNSINPSISEIEIGHLFSKEYDSSLSYRIMCQLRNHMLHYSLSVKFLYTHKNTIDTNQYSTSLNGPSNAAVAVPYINVSNLEKNKKFKRAILSEIKKTQKDRLNLSFIAREYAKCAFKIHSEIREETKFIYEIAKIEFEKTISAFREKYPHHRGSICIHAEQIESDNSFDLISNEAIENLEKRRNRWRSMAKIDQVHVSNMIFSHSEMFP